MRLTQLPLAFAIALTACSNGETLDPVIVKASEPILGEPVPVVPFGTPPAGVVTQPANNNLDVVEHDGRYFLAFRTAPSHFASDKTVLYVVSSTDQKSWTLEAEFSMQTDLREPRLLSFGGKLFFYFSVLGKDPLKFEPQGVRMSQYQGPGQWSDPVTVFKPGFLLWRAKTIDGKPYLVGYTGGGNIYEVNGEPITISWLTTEDGKTFSPVIPGQEVVETGGGSETDFVFLDDGALVAVTRNEAGDETGWGSKICRAEAKDLGAWSCAGNPRKYDSPLVFRDGEHVYLVGRRNVTESGNYNLGLRDMSAHDQTAKYEVEYSFEPKRCALWEVDPVGLEVSFVADLPSHGDTCFPGILAHGEGKYTIYNYTSPLDSQSEDWDWIKGQGLPTDIYRIGLQVP
ncbi:MAG: hypothetical protein QM820_41050 [Minicystis sp.]